MPDLTMPPQKLADYLRKSNIALALSSTDEDAPLVLVNDSFCALTGYSEEDVIGQNCRFLQGEDTTHAMRQPLHDFVHGEGPDAGRFPVLNYRKDGTPFHNYVYMSRMRDRSGEVIFILASQFDMTGALQRSKVRKNDDTLYDALTDIGQISREFGLAMQESSQLLADSVAVMARLTLDDHY